jgi:malate dehydrogenase (oxaloacetate-decarboxylating)(NADP+)
LPLSPLALRLWDWAISAVEVDELDPQKFIETLARLEPSFGGINLEDSKAPDCFVIESELKERMNIGLS